MENKIIVLTVANRPRYLDKVLQSYEYVRGIEQYKLIASVEPIDYGSEQCMKLLEDVGFMEVEAYYNYPHDPILKMVRNTFDVMTRGLQETNFMIYTEDDCRWAPDILELMEWADEKYRDDKSVFTVNGFSHNKYDPDKTRAVYRRSHCHAMTFGVWRDRWQPVLDNWNWQVEPGWDIHVDRDLAGNRHTIYPHLSRVEHIGIHGIHVVDKSWHDRHIYNQYWANNAIIAPEEWTEIEENDEEMDP